MRTLRHLLDHDLLNKISTEFQLKHFDVRMYLYLYFQPLASVAEHSLNLNISREVIRRSVARLRREGWVYLGPRSPHRRGALVVPWMPSEVETAIIAKLSQLRSEIHLYSEWLMKCLLDIAIHDRNYHDNARPQWLLNPHTGRRLELDRWYPAANIAFEFQGPQHFSADSRLITTEEQYRALAERDQLKRDICAKNKVELIEITAIDLDLEKIVTKVRVANERNGKADLFPFRSESPLVRELIGMCQNYVAHARLRMAPVSSGTST